MYIDGNLATVRHTRRKRLPKVPDTEVDLAAGRSASVTSRLKSMLKDARQEPLIRPMAADLAQAEITHELVVH